MNSKIKRCFHCGIKKKYNELITDIVDITRMLCEECYNIRECYSCGREYPIQYLLQDNFLPHLLCNNCYYYEIMMCERCDRMFYEYHMFQQKDGKWFCEKCDHYKKVSKQ